MGMLKTPLEVLTDYYETVARNRPEGPEFEKVIAHLQKYLDQEEQDKSYLQKLYDSLCPEAVPGNLIWSTEYYRSNDAALMEMIKKDWNTCLGKSEEELRALLVQQGESKLITMIEALDKAAEPMGPFTAICNMKTLDRSVIFRKARFKDMILFPPGESIEVRLDDGDLVIYAKTRKGRHKCILYIFRKVDSYENAVNISRLPSSCDNYRYLWKRHTESLAPFVEKHLQK